MPGAVETVGRGPFFDGFFTIGPQQPDAVAVALFSAKLIGELEKQRGRGATVVCADVSGFAQGIIRVVVAGDDDNSIARAGELGDDVPHRKFAFRSSGGEKIVFYPNALLGWGEGIFFPLFVCACRGAGAKSGPLTPR